ncbi:uncharacterized protein J8A68_005882 [[Candida] subhashii]|uniref:DNA-directed RNA polymerase N-terminal domain-containing protein n=1 Tax=[Candida] subhashii TaxID=561895 RepID=A0A8J5UIZ4_9ASCO|nr:uncharacterized protein J8A68_005882 [[Candida] subhashii]KAG7660616.1 hypothetical protein J8A68_005882 [[Candida] subhashii]
MMKRHVLSRIRHRIHPRQLLPHRYVSSSSHGFGFATSSHTIEPLRQIPTTGVSVFDIQREVVERDEPSKPQNEVIQFMSALSSFDMGRIFNSLGKLHKLAFDKILNVNGHKYRLETYYQCLQLTLTFYMKTQSIGSLGLLKQAHTDFNSVSEKSKKYDRMLDDTTMADSIRISILMCILHSYHVAVSSEKTRRFGSLISEYFFKTMKQYDLNIQKISGELKELYLAMVLKELCQKEKIPFFDRLAIPKNDSNVKTSNVPITPYLSEFQTISFENMAKYIVSNKFTWNGKVPRDMKLFDYYNTLSTEDRIRFMRDYTEFNHAKQLNVEEYSDLITTPVSSFQFERRSANSVAQKNPEIINKWIIDTSNHVNTILQTNNPKTDVEKVLCDLKPYLELANPTTLMSVLVSKIFSECSATEDNHAPIFKLRQGMNQVYHRSLMSPLIQDQERRRLYPALSQFNKDRLTHSLTKIFLDHASIPIDKERLELLNSFHESIPKEFMNQRPDGTYPAFIASRHEMHKEFYDYYLIKPHPILLDDLGNLFNESHTSINFPMLCPPKPWTKPDNGGLLLDGGRLVPRNDKLYFQYLRRASFQGELDFVYSSLDKLGSVAWAINPEMFDIFVKAMEFKEGFLKIPPPISPKPGKKATYYEREIYKANTTKRNSLEAAKDVISIYAENGDMFYHAFMLDFRGRCYPMSYFSHVNSDIIRGMLMFWHSKKLGDSGFQWLKYSASSLFGNKGFSMEQAIEFCDENLVEIIDSATDPFGGNKWWTKGDDPFELLACCKEIKKVLEFEKNGGKIEEYECRLPANMDGSCNGLQHYAALGKDEIGAAAVNLLPSETRKDVYVEVMNVVKTRIERDLEDDSLGEEQAGIARNALNILSRKLIKRPVMTKVYGVTTSGARQQIHDEIRSLIDQVKSNPGKWEKSSHSLENIGALKGLSWKVAGYLGKQVLDSISELFVSAASIQDWLVNNGDRLMKSYDLQSVDYIRKNIPSRRSCIFTRPAPYRPIIWTTPIGFPVIQIYRKETLTKSMTELMSITVKSRSVSLIETQKQRNGIAPNFIHSMDAAHMHMTADACFRNGLTFASVHDAFWTHAADVDQMSVLLREEFVKLHSMDLLENMRLSFAEVGKESFQLVWFAKSDNEVLYRELKEIRKKSTKEEYLYKELADLTERGKESNIWKLLEEHKPKLYFKQIGGKYVEYGDPNAGEHRTDGNRYVPVLVPFEPIPVPKKGNLDITKVMDSKFFFA